MFLSCLFICLFIFSLFCKNYEESSETFGIRLQCQIDKQASERSKRQRTWFSTANEICIRKRPFEQIGNIRHFFYIFIFQWLVAFHEFVITASVWHSENFQNKIVSDKKLLSKNKKNKKKGIQRVRLTFVRETFGIYSLSIAQTELIEWHNNMQKLIIESIKPI